MEKENSKSLISNYPLGVYANLKLHEMKKRKVLPVTNLHQQQKKPKSSYNMKIYPTCFFNMGKSSLTLYNTVQSFDDHDADSNWKHCGESR